MKFPKVDKITETPDDFMIVCKNCKKMQVKTMIRENNSVCLSCDFLLPRTCFEIIEDVCDEFEAFEDSFDVVDPISFKGYPSKQEQLRSQTGVEDAISTGIGMIDGNKVCLGVMDYRFIMGSLGTIVGSKLVSMFEYATMHRLPVVVFTVSGGARMQEGIIALMQMTKVVNAIKRHSIAGLFYMPVLTNPTTGGVTASFAQIGDMIIAEPGALICFAGPRVIKKTVNEDLPDGFQRSEFLLEKGFLDKVISRKEQRDFISKMIEIHKVVSDE